MKTKTLTIRLDEDLDKLLSKAARLSGKNRSEIAREALRPAAAHEPVRGPAPADHAVCRGPRLPERRGRVPGRFMRVMLNTKVLASAAATRGLRAVLSEHDLVICPQIVSELKRVLKDKFGLPRQLADDFARFVRQDSIHCEAGRLPRIKLKDKDLPDIPLVTAKRVLVYNKRVKNVHISPAAIYDNFSEVFKVLRGGSCNLAQLFTSCVFRNSLKQTGRIRSIGFRYVRDQSQTVFCLGQS